MECPKKLNKSLVHFSTRILRESISLILTLGHGKTLAWTPITGKWTAGVILSGRLSFCSRLRKISLSGRSEGNLLCVAITNYVNIVVSLPFLISHKIMTLQSLIYDPEKPSLSVLDQLLIPDEKTYVNVPDVETTWSVIRNMQIRGAL